jgi:hypothetical protein
LPVLAPFAADDGLCAALHSDHFLVPARPGVPAQHPMIAQAGDLFPMHPVAWVATPLNAFVQADTCFTFSPSPEATPP